MKRSTTSTALRSRCPRKPFRGRRDGCQSEIRHSLPRAEARFVENGCGLDFRSPTVRWRHPKVVTARRGEKYRACDFSIYRVSARPRPVVLASQQRAQTFRLRHPPARLTAGWALPPKARDARLIPRTKLVAALGVVLGASRRRGVPKAAHAGCHRKRHP
jgi:hypothetical protein